MAENGSVQDVEYASNGHEHDVNGENGKFQPRLNETAQKYMQELLTERARMENRFPLAVKLRDEALERVQLNGKIPAREQYADVYQQRTIKLSQKVHVPIKDKKFNYVGKLLGPKGNSLRRLQEETQCKIVILGRFSMKDRSREEELRNSSDTKYAHLNLPLHVEVSTIAPPAEAYARVAYALAELRRYLIPDKHDDIRQEQFRELMEDPEAAKKIRQQQQHQQQQGNGNNGNHRGGVPYRPKYTPHNSHFHHNDENGYYRAINNNNYHQGKTYMQVNKNQRSNPQMQPIMTAQGHVLNPSSSGMVVNTANFNGRGPAGGIPGTNSGLAGIAGSTGGRVSGGGPSSNIRAPVPYQFIKK